MRAYQPRAAMIDQINEIVRDQAVIQRHEHGANLRHRVKRFKLRVCVRREISDAIALPNSEPLQGGRPTIDTIKELSISHAQFAIHQSFAPGVELASAARKFQRGQRRFHCCFVELAYDRNAARQYQRPTGATRLCAINGTIFRGTSMAALM